MTNWLGELKRRFRGKRVQKTSSVSQRLRTYLRVEELQARNLPSATPVSLTGAGQLLIAGSRADDSAHVTQIDSTISVDYNGQIYSFEAGAVKKVCFQGGAGNDLFRNDTSIRSQASGGAGKDTLIGGSGDDVLQGGAGDDSLSGGGGKDRLEGGDGNDVLDGGTDSDTLQGGSGDDKEYGGIGDDNVQGGNGRDVLSGGIGDDRLGGGAGNDDLNGGLGDDACDGNLGDDSVRGGSGKDDVKGEHEDDSATLEAQLTSASSAATGEAEYHATSEEFEVEIQGAAASTSYDVLIDVTGDGTNVVQVGTITTDASGHGELELRDTTGIPTLQNGSIVQVKDASGEVIQGTLTSDDADEDEQEEEFKAVLSNDQGVAGLTGFAEFDSEEKEFELRIRGAAASTTYDVTVDGVVIGQITTNSLGRGELEVNLPGFTVAAGSTISVSDLAGNPAILAGTFVQESSDC